MYADLVGVDVYPIPANISELTAPYQGGAQTDIATTLANYLRWLDEMAGDRPYFMVLQAFDYGGLGGVPDTVQVRKPTAGELRLMACTAWEGGATVIGWWGQSFLTQDDALFWDEVLAVSQGIATDPVRYCALE